MDTKAIRLQLGLTQDAFAAKLGVAPYTVRRWEAGKAAPSPLAKEKLGRLLKKEGVKP